MSMTKARSTGARAPRRTIEPGMLEAGETVVWSTHPSVPGYALRKGLWKSVIGLLLLVGAWFFVFPGALRTEPLSAVLLVFGVFNALSLPWHAFHGSRMGYVLTNRRALVINADPNLEVSVPFQEIGFIDVQPSRNGSGDIYFKETAVYDGEATTTRREGFVAIKDVHHVERLLRDSVDRARGLQVLSDGTRPGLA